MFVLLLSELASNTAVATMMKTAWGWPLVESVHFMGLCLLVGSIFLFDLRLLGVMRRVPIATVHRLIPFGLLGFAINIATGSLFLLTEPDQYIYNPSFHFKLLFLTLAGLNIIVFYALTPVAWIVSLSLKSGSTITDGKFFPRDITFENYTSIFTSGQFTLPLRNSIGISLLAPCRFPKRVTLLYRPYTAAEAATVVESEVNAAQFRTDLRRARKLDPNARERADQERAHGQAAEEATGAGMCRVGLWATATGSMSTYMTRDSGATRRARRPTKRPAAVRQ